ncbi:MAG: zf-HC2 domain-containing protein [Candidatus Stahlbacteria bacterium]|nr:zf-HC2 domain-containing protein [Candidatus Stahlbacteria bacterium]
MRHINKRKLSAFLDSEVSEEEKVCITEHLKSCDYCQKELEKLSQILDYLDLIEEMQGSQYFILNLKQRITEKESKRSIRLPFFEWISRAVIPVGTTALFVVSLLLGSYLGITINQKNALWELQAAQDFDNLFGITLLNNLPENSLGNAYACLLTEGGDQ